ncbi:MAG: hypothetical protein R2737_00815 [Candidatus Nanopelagicales bacterium]
MSGSGAYGPDPGGPDPVVGRPAPAGEPRWTPFTSVADYLSLPHSLRPPVWRERRAEAERRPHLAGPPPAAPVAGAPVLVVPGFGASDDAFADLRGWLALGGWAPVESRLPGRRRCGSAEADEVEALLLEVADVHALPVTLVGHSRGGQLAKAAARRHPHLVAGVVAYGSPLTDPFGTHVVVRVLTLYLSYLTRTGRGDYVRECATGECCRAFHDDVVGRLPEDLPFWSLYSRTDGIVQWQTCLDPQARTLEVAGTHGGMPANPDVWSALATALADPRIAARLRGTVPMRGGSA